MACIDDHMKRYYDARNVSEQMWRTLEEQQSKLRDTAAVLEERCRRLQEEFTALKTKNGGLDVAGNDRLKLNVGGERVVLQRDTVLQFPESKLAALFSGRWENQLLRDKRNRIFMDVNPVCFRLIIEALFQFKLAGPNEEIPFVEPPDELQEVYNKWLDFFGLRGILRAKSPTLSILADREDHTMWLQEQVCSARWELLYRASSDGWVAQEFHARCDNRGPTLTLIRTTEGYIFGGYTDQSWNSCLSWIPSSKAFLFTVHCHARLSPTKLPVANQSHATYGHSSYGPVFGGGHEIRIADRANVNPSTTNFAGHYSCPTGLSRAFLTGSSQFFVSEIEVFLVRLQPGESPRAFRPRTGLLSDSQRRAKREGAADAGVPERLTDPFASPMSMLLAALRDEEEALRAALSAQDSLEHKFAEEKQFVEYFTQGEIVCINVAGKKIQSKRSTLMLRPDSAFARQFDEAWFQGDQDEDLDSDDEGILIEQSAYAFEKVVDHLRLLAVSKEGECLPNLVVDRKRQDQLMRLVRFYFPGDEAFILSMDSAILSLDAASKLLGFCAPSSAVTLLYRASRDGFECQRFHSHCDDQGPTITVVRTTEGYVFGGYTDQSWNSSNSWIPSSKAFLFALRCYAGLGPTKMPVVSESQATYGHTSYGPVFGGGHEIMIANCANQNASSYTKFSGHFECPAGQGHTFLTGSSQFQVSEIEVFRIEANAE